MRGDELVHRRRLVQRALKGGPVGVDHLHGQVVHEVLREVQHALQNHVRAAERAARGEQKSAAAAARRLARAPRRAQPPLDVLAVEDVPEQQLVLGQRLAAQHERRRPGRAVLQRERVHARERRRGGEALVFEARRVARARFELVGVVAAGSRSRSRSRRALDREQLREDAPPLQRARHAVGVRVARGGGTFHLQRQLQHALQALDADVRRGAREFGAGDVHEVHEEVALVQQEVLFQAAQPRAQVAVVEHRAKQPRRGVLERALYSRRHLPAFAPRRERVQRDAPQPVLGSRGQHEIANAVRRLSESVCDFRGGDSLRRRLSCVSSARAPRRSAGLARGVDVLAGDERHRGERAGQEPRGLRS